jgi:hypothetical protein
MTQRGHSQTTLTYVLPAFSVTIHPICPQVRLTSCNGHPFPGITRVTHFTNVHRIDQYLSALVLFTGITAGKCPTRRYRRRHGRAGVAAHPPQAPPLRAPGPAPPCPRTAPAPGPRPAPPNPRAPGRCRNCPGGTGAVAHPPRTRRPLGAPHWSHDLSLSSVFPSLRSLLAVRP